VKLVDGIRVEFVTSENYFSCIIGTPSMSRTARLTGADIVLLLAPGKTEADLSDDDIRAVLQKVKP
jgi:hypothetical protein